MNTHRIVPFLLVIGLLGCAREAETPPAEELETVHPGPAAAPEGPRFLAHHLFNVPAEQERKLLEFVGGANTLYRDLGYPETQYSIWRIAGDWEQQGEYRYLWLSIWPRREVYDHVHGLPEVQAYVETFTGMGIELVETYNRYDEVLLR